MTEPTLGVVPISWAALATSGRWRPEPNWLDRAGRVVGLGWIAAAAYACWWMWARC